MYSNIIMDIKQQHGWIKTHHTSKLSAWDTAGGASGWGLRLLPAGGLMARARMRLKIRLISLERGLKRTRFTKIGPNRFAARMAAFVPVKRMLNLNALDL